VAHLWTVRLSPAAISDYDCLDHSVASSVDGALEKLTEHPELRGYPLRGNLSGLRSLVVGKKKIRIVYRVIDERVMVYVVAIGRRHNDEVYIRAGARIKESPEG
jgi:mRNA interferase RelE/StbE